MNYYTTLETAIDLRDAGFPQPDYQFGQLWMTEDGRHDAFVGSKSWGTFKEWILENKIPVVFAPTATDILRELGGRYTLGSGKRLFLCYLFQNGEIGDYWRDENPAEACAKAWLEKNKPVSS